MSQPPKDGNGQDQPAKKPTAVPPRGKKGRTGPGGRPAPRSAGNRPSGRQARQAQARRNRNLVFTAIAVVVIVVVVVVVVGLNSNSSSGTLRSPAPAAAVTKVKGIPVSVLTAAVGDAKLVPAYTVKGGAVTKSSKPELLYIGAEFCPYCGFERWPMVIALSKFGTFTNLQQTRSATDDGNIGTWSFYGSTYTSPYLTFTPVEVENRDHGSLQNPTAAQTALWTDNTDESFPFVDFNGQAALLTAQASFVPLEEQSFTTILDAVGSNNNTIGAEVDAAAAVFMKHVCTMISNKAPACSSVASVSAPVEKSSTDGSSSS